MHFHLLYLLFVAAGSTFGQLFVPDAVRVLAELALRTFEEYVDYTGPSPEAFKTDPLLTMNASVSVGIHASVEVSAEATCTSSYWLENISHQGIAAFNSNPAGYQVFRNVKDFGAKGDGVTDDTAAINAAISAGGRCGIGGTCGSSTTTPAVVYFPAGVYMISSSIIQFYYTMLIGNPNCMPTIRAIPTYSGGLGMIDANPYGSSGKLAYGATNTFWREIKNLIIDMTLVPASSAITGLHWPTAQATNLQNMVFQMSSAPGTQHQGIFIEEGSGGFISDLVFNGGMYGGNWGNQQFTMRNLTFNNVVTAINQIWDWGWTYKSININNCTTGINMSNGGRSAVAVGSVTILDSTFTNTGTAINTARDANSQPAAGGSLIIENVKLNNVPVAIRGPDGPRLSGVSSIAGWSEGHAYTPNGPTVVQGQLTPNTRPASLLQSDGKYYERSKPSYAQLPVSSFLSARTAGATGNGRTDDTTALQNAINSAKAQGKVLYLDHGNYLVTNTIYIPAGSKIVGEAYSVILSSGSFFNDMSNPKPVVKIGNTGETGSVELSEFIVSTQGQQQGATLIEYNLVSPAGTPSGLWDVHTRIGGFAGSNLRLTDCAKTPNNKITSANLVKTCISGFMHFHITKASTGLYLENVWLWTADHDIEAAGLDQITIYTGRGLLDESTNGPVWLVGTGVEHNQLYEYQFVNAKNVWAGQIQTETAYYQPNPDAKIPFPAVSALSDPVFTGDTTTDQGAVIPSVNGWGLRIVNSQAILIYGAGLYSFFNNYSTTCSNQDQGSVCQSRIASIEKSSGISIYNTNTVGTRFQITLDGVDVARYASNPNGFVQSVALFRTS